MNTITLAKNDYKQTFKYPIAGFQTVSIILEFRENQLAWFMSITWGSFVIKNDRVAVSNNLLDPFKNILPFGICVTGPNDIDPYSLEAWSTGWTFNMLSSSEL